jgi:hypothetical protein
MTTRSLYFIRFLCDSEPEQSSLEGLIHGIDVYKYCWTAHVGLVWLDTWLVASKAVLLSCP